MDKFKNKKVAVIGEGLEGKSSVAFLEKQGAIVEIRDQKQSDDYLKDLDEFDLIVRSPGIKLSELITHNSELITQKVTSQTKLFMELCPTKNIIGVTGTKGKGTTSTLIYEMLKADGRDVYLGGNIGVPPLDFLEKLTSDSWVVLELSSFQLIDFGKSPADAKAMVGKPHIAVMLMVTSEHMDYHEDHTEYVEAKRNILAHQTDHDFAIVNRDYPPSNESDILTNGKVYYVSREREVEEGCFALGNQVILRTNGNSVPVIDTRELLLRGEHNQENVCAASIAAYLAGVRVGTIIKALQSFKGLEHRLELVSRINGVEYYNDSFSTTPETAIAAIKSFNSPEILLLGGSTKGSNFEELGKVIGEAENIKAIIEIGDEWSRIKAQIKTVRPETLLIEGARNMEQVIAAASKLAVPGDVVILSPAAASFDKFKNYKDRGNQFKEEVRKLED